MKTNKLINNPDHMITEMLEGIPAKCVFAADDIIFEPREKWEERRKTVGISMAAKITGCRSNISLDHLSGDGRLAYRE